MLYQLFEQSLWPTPIGARLASPPFPNGPSVVTQNARLSKNYKLVSAPGPLFDALIALPLGLKDPGPSSISDVHAQREPADQNPHGITPSK